MFEDKRKRSETLSYMLLLLLFTMFCLVLFALIKGEVKSEYGALVGGFGTTILGMFAVAVGFVWGSSKGSQLKDEAALASPPNPPPGTVSTTVTGPGTVSATATDPTILTTQTKDSSDGKVTTSATVTVP